MMADKEKKERQGSATLSTATTATVESARKTAKVVVGDAIMKAVESLQSMDIDLPPGLPSVINTNESEDSSLQPGNAGVIDDLERNMAAAAAAAAVYPRPKNQVKYDNIRSSARLGASTPLLEIGRLQMSTPAATSTT